MKTERNVWHYKIYKIIYDWNVFIGAMPSKTNIYQYVRHLVLGGILGLPTSAILYVIVIMVCMVICIVKSVFCLPFGYRIDGENIISRALNDAVKYKPFKIWRIKFYPWHFFSVTLTVSGILMLIFWPNYLSYFGKFDYYSYSLALGMLVGIFIGEIIIVLFALGLGWHRDRKDIEKISLF